MILENRIPPGERVNIDAIARALRVSQTPVREAVRRLEGDQLLHRVVGKGYRTSSLLDLDQLRELYEFRMLVDLWAVREVAVNRLSNPGRELIREVQRFEESSDGVEDIRSQLAAHDSAFHGLVHASLGNEWVRNAYAQTHSHVHTFRLYSPDIRGAFTVEEHTRIAIAVAACDADEAEAAMREHLTRAFHRFAVVFSQAAGTELRPPEIPRLRLPDATSR